MSLSTELRNTLTGLLLAVLGAATIWATSTLPTDRPAAADAGLLPRAIGIGLVAIGLGITLLAVIRSKRGIAVNEDADGVPIELPVDIPDELLAEHEIAGTDWRQVVAFALATAGYAVLALRVGFITLTIGFIVAGALVLGRGRDTRSVIVVALFAVGLALAYYVAFFVLLNVRHPGTPLP